MGQCVPVEGDRSGLGVKAQVDTLRNFHSIVQHLQDGTANVEVWQGLILMFLVQLKRKRDRVGIETCFNESVVGLVIRVLSKALPETAPMLSVVKPQTQTAMLRPPSCLLETIDDQIFSSLPVAGDLLHGVTPSLEGMQVLQRLSTAVINGALTHVISLNEPARESAGSKSQSSGRQPPQAFQDYLQADLTQIDSVLDSSYLQEGTAEEPHLLQISQFQQQKQQKQQKQQEQPPRQWPFGLSSHTQQQPPSQQPPGLSSDTQRWHQQDACKQLVQQQLSQRHCEWQVEKKPPGLYWDEICRGPAQTLQPQQRSFRQPVYDAWDMHSTVRDSASSSDLGSNSHLLERPWVSESSSSKAQDPFMPEHRSKAQLWTAAASKDMGDAKSTSSRLTQSTGVTSGYSKTTPIASHRRYLKCQPGDGPGFE